MTKSIDTVSKAARHSMVLRVTCRLCGKVRNFRAVDLMMLGHGPRDPRRMRFACETCPPSTVVVFEPMAGEKLQILRPILDEKLKAVEWTRDWL